MKLSPTALKKRYEKSTSHKDHWRSIYEDAYRYALPMRNLYDGYYESNSPGQDKMSQVFDSTAIQSTHRFANKLQSGVFPSQRQWCRLVPGEEIPEERRVQVQRVLDQYSDKMFDVMRQSAFDMAMGEFLLELAIGTAVMLIQPGDETQPIRYTTIPTFLITFDEGPHGNVEKVYRRMKRPFAVLDQEFPDIKIPEEMRLRYANDETELVEMIEGTYYDKQSGVYHYQIIDQSGNHELVYRELKSFPWVIARYMKAANERYGRGPVLTALPDIKTLNRVLELTLKNASLTIGGVFTAADDGVLNPATVSILPGAIIPVARNGGPQGESLRPLPRSGDPQLSQIVANDLRMAIKRILLDESLPPDNMSARSATEIQERMKELSQNLGASFGRLINETMYPVVRRTLEVMDELGMIELPLKVNGLQVRVVPSAPLAMAQSMERVGEVMQYMQLAQNFGIEGQMSIKPDALLDYIADQMSIPAEIRTSPEERQQMMMQMQQMAQQQMEAQQGGTEGQQAAVNQ
jgi:antitoxin component of RelBE/YafQ-DinJ toxin-antitoxin module